MHWHVAPVGLVTTMRSPKPSPHKFRPGMTLLELTVIVVVMLLLISVLFMGTRAWKRGSDRAGCVLHIRNAQQAIRSYANLRQLEPGSQIPGGVSRKTLITGPDSFMREFPVCPGGGVYAGQELTTIPQVGVVMMTCDYEENDMTHVPEVTGDW